MTASRVASFRRLEAWQIGMDLAIRRAATSIPANIAEGYSRRSRPAYVYHVSVALGSHGELETLVELAVRLGLLEERRAADLDLLCGQVGRLLSALHKSLDTRGTAPRAATVHSVANATSQGAQPAVSSHQPASQSPQSPAPSPRDRC